MTDEGLDEGDLIDEVDVESTSVTPKGEPGPLEPGDPPRTEKPSAASIGWLVAISLGVIVAARQWLVTTPYFALRDVRIEGAAHRSVAQYEEAAGLVRGRNVLALDIAEVRRKLHLLMITIWP